MGGGAAAAFDVGPPPPALAFFIFALSFPMFFRDDAMIADGR
jgi:hypothetical protein